MKNEYSKRTNEPETPLKSPPKRKPTRHLTRKKAGKTRIFRSSEPLAKMYPLSRGALKGKIIFMSWNRFGMILPDMILS